MASKISRLNENNETEMWISATEFDSYCKNDPILNWFQSYETDEKKREKREQQEKELEFLFDKGREFENYIISLLRQKTGLPLEKHSSLPTSRDYTMEYDVIDTQRVIQAMRRGDPLIYSAYLSDSSEMIRGIPDLLIRNDYVNILFPLLDVSIESQQSMYGNYYYLPIEIKFSSVYNTLQFDVRNINRIPFYKTQLYFYCQLLYATQGVLPSHSLIIGKRTIMNGESYHSLDYPGIVSYKTTDSDIVSLYRNGLQWLRAVKKNGAGWQPDFSSYDQLSQTPFFQNLLPNMKNKDSLYEKEKQEIASKYGEITELWQCSVKHRNNALRHSIISSRDPRLTAEIMEIKKGYQSTLNDILKVNRGELGDYFPQKLTKNTHSFMNIENDNEMFVDFEVLTNFSKDGEEEKDDEKNEYIFLIGVYYKDTYTSFTLSELTPDAEFRILNDFYHYWENNEKPVCWYWYAENNFWKRALKRHSIDIHNMNIDWRDMYDIVYKEPFVVKGCKNFKLKSYISQLQKMGYLSIDMPPETCTNGLDALFIAWKYYYCDKKNESQFSDMITYNRFDCMALYHLISFLRKISL